MNKLKDQLGLDLRKSLGHLRYSFGRIQSIDLKNPAWTESELEVLESFSSRFARSSEIFISKYLRLLVLEKDPGFRGPLLDLLNFAEKSGLILSAAKWFRIRELRNVAAHEYTANDLSQLYQEVARLTPIILDLEAIL